MDHVKEEFLSLFKQKLRGDENDFKKIFDAFKNTCYELSLNERKDISLFSIIFEVFEEQLYLSLYYQIVQTKQGEPTDNSCKITVNIFCKHEEDESVFENEFVFEDNFFLDSIFKNIEELKEYNNLLDKEVGYYI